MAGCFCNSIGAAQQARVTSGQTRWHRPGRLLQQVTSCSGKGFGERPSPAGKISEDNKDKKAVQQRQPATLQALQDSVPVPRKQPGQPAGQRPQIQEVPEVVNERLLNRILLFSGLPVLFGMLLFPFFIYIQTQLHVELPTGTVFATTGLAFGLGLLGISYGVLSASWDANEEGSLLGIDEFKQNAGPFVERVVKGVKDKR